MVTNRSCCGGYLAPSSLGPTSGYFHHHEGGIPPGGGGGTTINYCAEPISAYQAHADSIYAPLNKALIPSGIFYDRISKMAGLVGFNVVAPDTSSFGHFRQSIYELHAAAYNTAVLPCQQDVRDYAQLRLTRDTVAIGVLHYRFGYLDSTAVANNLVYWDGNTPAQLHDVPGRARSPYLTRDVTVVAALVDKPRNGTITFRLDPALFFTNTGRGLSSAAIDFDDGNGSQSLWFGQTRTVSYGSTGIKVLRYTLVFSDGTQQTTCSTINVITPAVFARGNVRPPVSPCYSAPLLTADITYARNGRPGVGDVSYYYSDQSGSCLLGQRDVTKPVVLIDGFDHDDDRKAGNLYADGLVYDDAIGQERNLGEELRAQGYDVVILNFPTTILGFINNGFFRVPILYRGGSSYIESNAFVLVKLLQQLQTQMGAASTEKITIVGPSMGGQIARYALAYMEKNTLSHNVGLYVSLDSPHNGANTPIGDQLFLKYFAEDIGKAEAIDGLQQINSPASRELSLQHYSQLPVSTIGPIRIPNNTVPFQADPERGRYLANLSAAGNWPQQPRRIAVTNGSLSAIRQLKTTNSNSIVDGEQAFYLRGKFAGIGVASARVYFSSGYGSSMKMVEGHYPIGNGRNYYAIGPAGSCGLDGVAGGWFDINQEIAEKVTDRKGITIKTIYSLQKNACFIPMHSALAYQPISGGPDDYCQPLTSDLVCAGTTPFDAYYGPLGLNEAHTQLTAGNVAFMRNEILRITPKPILAAGPDFVCPNGGTFTYSLVPECVSNRPGHQQPGTTYNWTLTAGATFAGNVQQVTNGGTSQAITFATTARATVVLSVTAVRTGYVASTPLAKYINITSAYASVTAPGEVPKFTTFDAVLDQANTTGPYTWTVTPRTKALILNIGTANGPSIQVRATNAGVATITATGTDICTGATVIANSTIVTITPGVLRPAPEKPAAYPNPADAVLHIEAPEITETPDATVAPRTAVLYNAQGREVRRLSAPQAAQLSTAGLPEGLYYLLLEQNGRVTRHQIRVQH